MHKRVLSILLVCTIIIFMTSCAYMNPNCPPELYLTVDYIYDETLDEYYLTYQGEKYIYNKAYDIFSVPNMYNPNDMAGLLALGWHYAIPGYTEYYSYTTDSPDYLFDLGPGGQTWIKETFDYTKEIFIVEGTESEIAFSDLVGDLEFWGTVRPCSKNIFLTLNAKNHPKLKIEIYVDRTDYNRWYAYDESCMITYALPDTFVQLLEDNGII